MPPAATQDRQKTHPALHDAQLAILHDYLELRAARPENRGAAERAAQRGLKATALAPTLHICRALLRGERIHWTKLDRRWGPRYQIRDGRRRADGRYILDDLNDVPR